MCHRPYVFVLGSSALNLYFCHMRQFIWLWWLLPLLASAQKKHAVVTYAAQKFKLQVYAANWEKESEELIPIHHLKGEPTAESYHTTGSVRSCYLSRNGQFLYFSLHHMPDATAGTQDSTASAFLYVYDRSTKRTSKVMQLPPTTFIPWEVNEVRQTVLVYDYLKQAVSETSLISGTSRTLFYVTLHASNYRMWTDSTHCHFVYVTNDSIRKTTYHFESGVITTTFLFKYPDFAGYEHEQLLVFSSPGKGNLTYLISPQRRSIKTIPRTNDYAAWRKDGLLFITEENALCLYNNRLELVRSHYMQAPVVLQVLGQEAVVVYSQNHSRVFGVVDENLQQVTSLPEVHDNFIQLITDIVSP